MKMIKHDLIGERNKKWIANPLNTLVIQVDQERREFVEEGNRKQDELLMKQHERYEERRRAEEEQQRNS